MRLPTNVALRAAIILSFFSVIAATEPAKACDCPPPRIAASALLKPNSEALAALHNDVAVFIGRVVAQSSWTVGESTYTTFRVLRVLKGTLPSTLTLIGISGNDTSCGLNLYVTQINLFLIYKTSEREWFTSVCAQPRPDVTPATLFDFLKRDE